MAQTGRLAGRVQFGTAGMLRITIHDSARELRIKLEGKLSGPWVEELRQCWRTASSTTAGRTTSLDLSEVDFVDAEGQSLLSEMHRQGSAAGRGDAADSGAGGRRHRPGGLCYG